MRHDAGERTQPCDALLEGRRTRQAARLLYAGEPGAEAALARLKLRSRREALVDVAREWVREERTDEAAALLERVLRESADDVAALRLKAEHDDEGRLRALFGMFERLARG